MKNKTIFLFFLLGTILFASNLGFYTSISRLETNVPKANTPTSAKKNVLINAKESTTKVFVADILQGTIGVAANTEVDDAYDNVFHIQLSQMPTNTQNAYLEYDLYGFDQAASIARSVNNQKSMGGQFLSPKKAWTKQSELLSQTTLRQGDNVVLFTAPNDVTRNYKVKNLRIVYKPVTAIASEFTMLKTANKIYLRGVNFPSKIKKRSIAGIAVDVSLPEFELVLERTSDVKSLVISTQTTSGKTVQEIVKIEQFTEVKGFKSAEEAKKTNFTSLDFKKECSLHYEDFVAYFPQAALKGSKTISLSGLRPIDIAPLNAAMVNVTATNAGYRLLPHGTVFEKAVSLSVPYNKKNIPEGYTEKDIQVFYFNENKRLWQEIPKDSVDSKKGIITAKTTHFTDFIAGIIKMPESPETSGYTPTSIKDLKAANPMVGIQSIAPPAANARGTAATSFGIELPKGRGGMQPAFSLQYDSDGGHSWAGLGWDISVPAVSIETRWGAPRYDAANETESYAIAGEALLPNAHRTEWIARVADKQFYPRREAAFQQILRKGNAPTNYYWVVKDKSGVASYYGGTPNGLANNAVLQDATGNIGHWALCFQIDLKGNTISYEYDKTQGELYLKKVFYSGFGTDKGNYNLTFVKNGDLGEANRQDVQINARLGFKQLNNQLLRKIEVRYKEQMIRSYELQFTEGAFKKTVLKSISQFDADGKLFYTNTLDYFDDVRDASGKYNPFAEEQKWEVPKDNIKRGFTGIKGFESNHTLAGSTNGSSNGKSYSLGVGPMDTTFKLNTVGGHGANNSGKSETFVLLQDLDGDAYPDKIFSKDNTIYYCKNLMASKPFSFDAPKRVVGINNLGFNTNKSFSWGVDASVGGGKLTASIGYDEQRSTNKTLSYFMDFNGDGLVDFVNNGRVLYNRQEDGIPVFAYTSSSTPAPVFGNGKMDLEVPDLASELEELLNKNPLNDVVRMWEAPADGKIIVNQSYQLIEDSSTERQEYKTRDGKDKADGVHLYCQFKDRLLWDELIAPTDFSSKTRPSQTLTVEKGDRLYFRVSSIKDGSFDKIIWNPNIAYTEVRNYFINEKGQLEEELVAIENAATDANLISLKNFDAANDFFASKSNAIVVPKPGDITFEGTFNKPVTSDHVLLKITKNISGSTLPEVILYERLFLASEVVALDLSSLRFSIPEENAFITTTIASATNIAVKNLVFDASIILPPSPGTEDSENIKKINIGHSFYKKTNGNYLINGLKPTINGRLQLYIKPENYVLYEGIFRNRYDGDLVITAKQNGMLVARHRYKLVRGVLQNNESTLDVNYAYTKAQKNIPIDLEMYGSNASVLELIRPYPFGNLTVNMDILPLEDEEDYPAKWETSTNNFSVFTDYNETETSLGLQYKKWGRFALNGNLVGTTIQQNLLRFNADNSIDTGNLPNPDSLDPDAMPDNYDTNKKYFNIMVANYSKNIMYGGEEESFIQNEFMGSSRLGEDDFADYTDFSEPENATLVGGETDALDMISISKSRSIGARGGFGGESGGLSGGISGSNGTTRVVQTMSDLNGDRFPDYIRNNKVQFTTPVGGKEKRTIAVGNFSESKTKSYGGSLSGSFNHAQAQNSLQTTTGKNNVKTEATKASATTFSKNVSGTISLGGNVGKSEDESVQIYSDINGDGLADKVETNQYVSLNTGYGFLAPELWQGMHTINKGKSLDVGANMGYSIYNGSIAGGLNYSKNISDNTSSFLDINSDGLGDKIHYKDNEVVVELNLGDSFAEGISYPRYESMTRSTATSYGGSVNVSYPIPIPFLGIKIVPGFGVSKGWSTSRTEATFTDIDGDGNLDYIRSEDEDDLVVRLSNIKRTNKLKGVTNAMGNSFVIDYELLQPSYQNPNAKWVLASVDVNDGHQGDGIDHSIAKFSYADGYYDRREREFYGFAKISQQQIDAADNSVFATTIQEFYNQDFYRKNLLIKSTTLDKENKIRQESSNEYNFIEVSSQTKVALADLGSPNCDAKRIFVAMVYANQKMFEGGADYLETNTYQTYDANGNITQYEDLGNGSTTDKVTAKISYHESANPYYGGIPKQLEVFTVDGLRRKRATEINPKTAEVSQIKNYIAADKIALTDIAYDAYGNLKKITGPANYKNQRMTLEYTYDADNHQFMTLIKDAFGYQNTISYDYRFGSPLKTTDRNEQSTNYSLDAVGRTKTIQGPYEIASGKPYTIAYEYYPTAKVPLAKTHNYDPELQKDIDTYTYTDGLGRALQVKKTASLFTAPGSPDQEVLIVSGKVVYDGLGRPTESYYPTTTTSINDDFSTAVATTTPTKTNYDLVGRATKVNLPDGSSNTTSYQLDTFEGIKCLLSTQTDALGKTLQTYTDVQGSNLASKQNDLLTKFTVNALGETTQVTDAMKHITKSSYDWLGRRTEFTHPDAGTSTMEYDLAGNLTRRITQDIRNITPPSGDGGLGGAIVYDYDYNRLEAIKYPKNPQNNVQYNYGSASQAANRRGRLWLVQDASGGQEFFYGKLGEVEKEIRTLRITPTDVQTYVSEFAYDTWNRIQKMTYPDGEVVDYTYNRAGNLQSMQGKKESHTYDYIKQLSYDEFEQRKYLKYGNDTQTNYQYDPVMRRLQQLQVNSNLGRQIMNNAYRYDVVGNVLSIQNTAPIVANTLGGTAKHEFQYDDFYRLKTAKASYEGEFTKASYALNMQYNKMHNITQKNLVHTLNNEQKGYVLNYAYDNELHPNAPSSISEAAQSSSTPPSGAGGLRSYTYDGNGNPTYIEETPPLGGGGRKMNWDEENRLMGINDNGRVHLFTYDAGGERVLKSSGSSQNVSINGQNAASIVHTEEYTGYVSPYFVISKSKFTKHYFEGAGRIVSKLGNGAFAQPLQITAGGINYTALTAAQQKALDEYVKTLGTPPGPPTQMGIYASPAFTGAPYPSAVLAPTPQNQEPPLGWPRNPSWNAPGDVPGPPAQFGAPVAPELVPASEGFTGTGLPENDIFYFHPDHLGSTSYISNKNGGISQHVEYIAFGEVLFEEHSSSFSSPYLFNGKELDRETNLSYYGARYLDMKTSLWLNVDPLAEKFFNQSAYNYCFNNPVRLTDPTGMGPDDPPGEKTVFSFFKIKPSKFIKSTNNGNGAEIVSPDGKTHAVDSKVLVYTYSNGEKIDGQQKKAGIWSFSTKKGHFLWNNVKGKYVLNTSDKGAAKNSFPGSDKPGTTYAGGDNPKNKLTGDDDYSQPPQNLADYGGYVHDKEYDQSEIFGIDGVLSTKSTKANDNLIRFCNQIISLYKRNAIDPFTGAPISKKTYEAALNMSRAFILIETPK